MFETRQIGKVVQHRNFFLTIWQYNKKALQVIKHKLQLLYQINRSKNSSTLVVSTNLPLSQKGEQNKLCFLVFFPPTSITFCYSLPPTSHILFILFFRPDLTELSHSQSPQYSKTYLQSLETKPETHLIL